MEWCCDYEERKKFIEEHKSKNEVALRLRIFQPVQGELPEGLRETGTTYRNAREKFAEAISKYEKAQCDYDKVKAWWLFKKAKKADAEKKRDDAIYAAAEAQGGLDEGFDKAKKEWNDALGKYDTEALHAKECPNCTWDGKTLVFPNKVEE